MVQTKQDDLRVLDGSSDQSPNEDSENQSQARGQVGAPIRTTIGLDISTSVTGYCVLDHNGRLIRIGAIKLTSSKLKDHFDKAEVVKEALLEAVKPGEVVEKIYVEASHMRFTPGFSSAKTLFSLAKFNGVVSHIAYELFNVKPEQIGVRSARKALGIKINTKDKSKSNKDKVFEAVRALNPNFPWETHVAKTGKSKGQAVYGKHNYDMADAWVIARGGQLL